MRRAANEHVFAWIAQIRSLTAGRPEPEQIIVAPACPAATIVPPLSRQMTEIYSEIGIWWATGWYEVPVELRDDELASAVESGSGTVVLGYCPGQPATIE
jgi:hypothetical protein